MAKQNMSRKGRERFNKKKPPRGERLRKAPAAGRGDGGRGGARAGKPKAPGLQQRQRVRRPAAVPALPLGFAPAQRVLLVGEGDLSFSCALARLFGGDGSRLTVTTYDEEETCTAKYEHFAANADELRAAGATLGHGVDATDLPRCLKALRKRQRAAAASQAEAGTPTAGVPALFDRVVFQFPHRGEGIKDQDVNVRSNQELLLRFFPSALTALAPHGELLVTLKTGLPYDLWGVCRLASTASANALALRTAHVFSAATFPGYRHRRTLGDATSRPTEEELGGGARTYVWRRTAEAAAAAEATAGAEGGLK
jgi:25S rRNA (uracil2634-N3)-methyltransferase